MPVKLSSLGGAAWQFFTDNGIPLAGGKLISYAAGTTTPLATYTSATGLSANTNPIILDSAGRVAGAVWLTEGQLYKFVLTTAADVLIGNWDDIGGVNDQAVVGASITTLNTQVAALQAFDTSLGQSGGSNLIGFINSGTGAFARPVQARLRETVSVKDFNAVGDGTANDTDEIQAAITSAAGRTVTFPPGTYLITTKLTVPAGTTLRGAGSQMTYLVFRNCDGIEALGDAVTVSDMYIWSQSAAGVPDPKTSVGILVSGVNGAKRSYFVGERLYLRGWNACVQWSYTWGSSLLQCTTINCNNSLYLFGQSVNNYVTNCELVANTGTAVIACAKDTGAGSNNTGEGLMVTNTLLALADNCVNATSFLSLGLSNCVIDLAQSAGVVLTDCQAVMISGCWIYGALFGVVSNDTSTGVDLEMGNSITGCRIQSVATNAAVIIGANNVGWSITGNMLKAAVECINTDAASESVAITGNFLSTPATYGLTLLGTDTVQANNVGNDAVTP
jgi:hypothetical protein